MSKSLLEFFTRSLGSFQQSSQTIQVLTTLQASTYPPPPWNPATTRCRIVVLDSSFNPPTSAHAHMALAALENQQVGGQHDDAHRGPATDAQRLVLLLSVNNADKAPKPASFPHRLTMMEVFGRDILERSKTPLEVDVAVTTLPYFHDKSAAMAAHPAYATASGWQPHSQVFLAGFDTLVRILQPKYYGGQQGMLEALAGFFSRAQLRITMRPDDEWGTTDDQRAWAAQRDIPLLTNPNVVMVDAVQGERVMKAVSSSKVRHLAMTGDEAELDGYVCDEVKRWILEQKLFRKDLAVP
ncbi:hypothetical protein N3K66_003881 [Trichothecium roseum]|uniref:Uncharacterized protein n=1 Tax=Trichothecium roseum TaxID=47278 RepID=A0ACC0V6S6_9HYPO|nr:hypothetical protein N3K66_003881 [Trichothecium roseum]